MKIPEPTYIVYCKICDWEGNLLDRWDPAMGDGHNTLEAAESQATAILAHNRHVKQVKIQAEYAPVVVREYRKGGSQA